MSTGNREFSIFLAAEDERQPAIEKLNFDAMMELQLATSWG